MTVAALMLVGTLPLGAELVNGIMVVVDDGVITKDEVDVSLEHRAEVLYRRYRTEPATLEKQLDEIRPQIVEELVKQQLILHEFKTAGYNLPDSLIDELVQQEIRAHYQNSRAVLTKTLEKEGMTYEKFRKKIREQFIIEQLRLKNISSEKIIISPHKVETYYLAHRDEFKLEDEVKLRVIVLKATDDTNAPAPASLAEEILTKLKEGASFEQMASLYSQGSQRNQGGDWGWWARSELTKGLSDVAFALPVGKCSGVVSRSLGDDYWVYQYEKGQPILGRHYGIDPKSNKQALLEERKFEESSSLTNLPPAQEFYLLQVEDTHPAHFKSLSEVRDQIEKNLLLDEKNRLEKDWIVRLRKKTFVASF
jgi:parvulin-like peptidyl-prolyl isomerase